MTERMHLLEGKLEWRENLNGWKPELRVEFFLAWITNWGSCRTK